MYDTLNVLAACTNVDVSVIMKTARVKERGETEESTIC